MTDLPAFVTLDVMLSAVQTDELSGDKALLSSLHRKVPSKRNLALGLLSAVLLILSFPDFNLWPLAWVALAPLLIAIYRDSNPSRAFVVGWFAGTLYFYGSCYWLTYSMIRYGGIPAPFAFLLLFPVTLIVGVFPGLFSAVVARCVRCWGSVAVLLAAFVWPAFEWGRFMLTGELWNAIGYSQAYALGGSEMAPLIQAARWGGVYAVSMLLASTAAAIALVIIERQRRAFIFAAATIFAVILIAFFSFQGALRKQAAIKSRPPVAAVVAVQPNVPMTPVKSLDESAQLLSRHLDLSHRGLQALDTEQAKSSDLPRLVIWPESPMNFAYTEDLEFREFASSFTRGAKSSLLFNSLEPAAGNGAYNSAIMVDPQGHLVARYDKIHLLPFGEYVPIPRWIPGARFIPAMVGDFTPGTSFPLMPVGGARAAVFICFESAFPSVSREFTKEGADFLINISNDGYLGPTAVRRQHLANAVFRAVENENAVVRVTNTGISALITPGGSVHEATADFTAAVREWLVPGGPKAKTVYTRFGDWFALTCAALTMMVLALSFRVRKREHF
jgi:apolipoprotein N-acyltransferase